MKKTGKKNIAKVLSLLFTLTFLLTNLVIPLNVSAYGPSTMFTGNNQNPNYARAIQLQHSGAYNGRMYATFEYAVTNMPVFKIFESTNNGSSWTQVSSISDTVNGWGMRYQPHLYELPQAIGDMPAGTILCAGNSIPSDMTQTKIDIYKSTDQARTWTFLSSVATGGHANPDSNHDPVWEPFLLVANNKLICYYADERDAGHNQKIVHQTTINGTSWSSIVEDVALTTQYLRPGMPTIAKMANGQYIMTYEIMAISGDPTYFKISSNPESWNSTDQGTKLSNGGTPYVTCMPNGKIIVSTYTNNHLYVNTANGTGGWTALTSPLEYGYSRCLVPLSNGRLFLATSVGLNLRYADMDVGSGGYIDPTKYYKILVRNNTNYALDCSGTPANGTNVQMLGYVGNNRQQWQFEYVGSGFYKIKVRNNTNYILDCSGTPGNGTNVQMWQYLGIDRHQWQLEDVGGGYYKFKIANNMNYVLDCSGTPANGTNVQMWQYIGIDRQQWQLVEVP